VLNVRNIRIRNFDVSYLDVYWDVDPVYDDIHDYEFILEKSNSQFGPFFDLTKPFVNKYHVRDNTVRGKLTDCYYRVRVKHLPTEDEQVFPHTGNGINLSAPPDLIALEMARVARLKLKEFEGRKVWVFPRKNTGQRCACFDPVTKRKMRSKCRTCYDTGYVGGYDSPMEIYGQIHSPAEATSKAVFGDIKTEDTIIILPNFPEVEEGWVVVENENIRWRINTNINKVKKARSIIKQVASIHRIPDNDIEYLLPINVEDPGLIFANPPRNMTNPQTLASSETVDKALDFYKS
jgi:hypothetical protein